MKAFKNLTCSVKKTGQEVFAVSDLKGKFENLSKLLTGLLNGRTTLWKLKAVTVLLLTRWIARASLTRIVPLAEGSTP